MNTRIRIGNSSHQFCKSIGLHKTNLIINMNRMVDVKQIIEKQNLIQSIIHSSTFRK